MMRKTVFSIALIFCVGVSLAADYEKVYWKRNLAEGFYQDPSSWELGVAPSGMEFGYIDNNFPGDVTVKIPQGGLVDPTGFIGIRSLPSTGTETLTIDVRGTRWVKKRAGAWPQNWVGFMLAVKRFGGHVFNLEGLGNSNKAVLELDDALIRMKCCHTNVQVILESGLINVFDPNGEIHGNSLYLAGSGHGQNVSYQAIVKPECTLRVNYLRIRGDLKNSLMRFEGGNHYINGELVLKDENGSPSDYCKTVTVEVASGSITNMGICKLGDRRAGGTAGFLHLMNDAVYFQQGSVCLGAGHYTSKDGKANVGILKLDGSSKFTGNGWIYLANGISATGLVSIADHAELNSTAGMDMGWASGTSYGKMEISQNAKATFRADIRLGKNANDSRGELLVRDQGVLEASKLVFANDGGNASGLFRMEDQAKVSLPGGIWVKGTSADAPISELQLAGGELRSGPIVGSERAVASLDGMTLRPASQITETFIRGFSSVLIGNNGLVMDCEDRNLEIGQALTGGGSVQKKGKGKLTLTQDCDLFGLAVSEGELQLGENVSHLADQIEVNGGALLSLEGPSASLRCARFSLGDSKTSGLLRLDVNDVIEVTEPDGLTVTEGQIILNGITDNGNYELFRVKGNLPADLPDRLILINPQTGKNYRFTSATDEAGNSKISVTVEDTVGSVTWSGAEGSEWDHPQNWIPAKIPSPYDQVIFPAESGSHQISINQKTRVSSFLFEEGSAYRLTGGGKLEIFNEIETGGNESFELPVAFLGSRVELAAAASTTSTVQGAISSMNTDVVKKGDGTLDFDTPENSFAGRWIVESGRLTLEGAGGIGDNFAAMDAILLKGGTFRYDAAPMTVDRGMTIKSETPVVADIRQDLTLLSGFNFASVSSNSAFVKIGPGKLKAVLPEGKWNLSKALGDTEGPLVKCNIQPTGTPVCEPNGNWTNWTGLACLNILEGTLHLKGQGADKTEVMENTWNTMGGGWKSTTDPVLVIENLKMISGNSGRHFLLGNAYASGCAPSPTLQVINGAVFDSDAVRMGAYVTDQSLPYTPTLIVSNAVVRNYWHIEIPDNGTQYDNLRAIVRCSGPSAKLHSYGTGLNDPGIYFGRTCDVLFEKGARLEQIGKTAYVFYSSRAKGRIEFNTGAVMQMMALCGNNSTHSDSIIDLRFDDATMMLTRTDVSLVAQAAKQGISIGENGMRISIPQGISHQLRIPLRGVGGIRKVGPGELILGKAWEFASSTVTNKNCDVVTGSFEGTTAIDEGTLSIEAGAIRGEMVYQVASGASLDLGGADAPVQSCTLSGSGTVSHAHISAEIDLSVSSNPTVPLTFRESVLEQMVVDFNRSPTETCKAGERIAVAKLDPATAFQPLQWKGIHVGKNLYATFVQDPDGTVYAEIGSGGSILILK